MQGENHTQEVGGRRAPNPIPWTLEPRTGQTKTQHGYDDGDGDGGDGDDDNNGGDNNGGDNSDGDNNDGCIDVSLESSMDVRWESSIDLSI